jgi:RNA polymerase sigma-70 factor (ECF subfamily)
MADEHTFFAELVDHHGAAALAMLRRLCGNPHDADDVFQDVAVRVWRRLGSRPVFRHPRAWLMTIAYHAFLDHKARRPAHAALGDDDPPDWRGGDDPGARVEGAESREQLDAAVAELPEGLREVVVLHYTGGLTLREVARATGLPGGTVKSRLNAGLERLRRRLS